MATSDGSGGQFEVSGRKGKDDQKEKDDNSAAAGTGETNAPAFEVSGRKGSDVQNATDDNSATAGTKGTDALTFEVNGRKAKDGRSTATQNEQDDGTAAIARGAEAMSIDEVGGRKGKQEETGVTYMTATLKQSLDVFRATDDAPCDLTGLVILQDKIVVSDQANYKLKVFDMSFNFKFDYKCEGTPFDIALLDNTTIVVTFKTSDMRLFSVGDDGMIEIGTIDTEYSSFGVCCYGGNIYCVILDKIGSETFSQVRMYTPDGRLKRWFEYLSYRKMEYNVLQYITVNQSGILYVTDWYKGAFALSTRGDVFSIMSHPLLQAPQGIAVDDFGHIYVCGYGSDNLIKLSADGHCFFEFLSSTIRCKFPRFVRISGNQLFLGRRNSNIISVYELSELSVIKGF